MTPAIERLIQLAEVARTRIQSLSPVADALVYELGEAIREVEAGPWQPIETAPNEESILVAYNDGSVDFIEDEDNDYQWKPYNGEKPERGITTPTHWMPLPEAPIEDRRRENGE